MARGQAGGAQSSSARDMKMFLRNRMWRDHWYVLVSVGVIVVALFGSAFLQFSTSQDHVYRLEVSDSAMMERVFRSGEPWVVLCSGPDDVLPEVFDKVSPRLAGKSFVGVLDCKQKLPTSGKSVLKRYGIRTSISPTVFTVANGENPKQVFLNHLQSATALAKHVKARTKKTMQQVQNSAQLEARCLSRSGCVLFLRGQRFQPYEKQWIDKLMHKHRTLSFAWIDSTRLKLSLENLLPDAERGQHRMVLFRRQRDPDTRKKVLAAKAYRDNVLDAVSVATFLDDNAHADSLKPLAKSPKVLHRKKKSKASQPEATGDSEQRRPRRDAEEKGDDYYFPQHVEHDEDEDADSVDDIEEEEDVLDLDDGNDGD
ncbi:hypothetical protein PHYSODRAFT_255011 [Phytophthora sojae]|uniref:Thioredoxin domain-containing protein n=1 Tax=Phytophthora sojae (strain P6497) TaxID=1094619 RepID=G4YU89_PHYSP|nr:hypothetical protein PHYSODRAFT_255011 [Phytophthora sojae]EGZ23644.1 hypothetical protein PHYSODRAFT_255011 [Phytophthora sojae]|eukprot:XP_009518932.1 hypothetical protein PHYSODRAFT_255011 [Phytophthora sojae]